AVALWIRRRVREPEVWEREAHQAPRLAELFAPGLRHATFGGLAMCIVTLVAWWGTNAFLPLVAAFLAGPDAAPSVRAGFCYNAGRYLAAAGPFVVGRALGAAATPMDAIRWMALVPLAGLVLVPFVVEPRRLTAAAPGSAAR